MKGNKKRRVVMRRQQSLAVLAKRIILPIIALGIFVLLTRTIGSAPQHDDKGRQFVHLRGGNNKNLVWVHSDSQPFVSGTCLVIISLEGLCNYLLRIFIRLSNIYSLVMHTLYYLCNCMLRYLTRN